MLWFWMPYNFICVITSAKYFKRESGEKVAELCSLLTWRVFF